jgi:hypothetical protein
MNQAAGRPECQWAFKRLEFSKIFTEGKNPPFFCTVSFGTAKCSNQLLKLGMVLMFLLKKNYLIISWLI